MQYHDLPCILFGFRKIFIPQFLGIFSNFQKPQGGPKEKIRNFFFMNPGSWSKKIFFSTYFFLLYFNFMGKTSYLTLVFHAWNEFITTHLVKIAWPKWSALYNSWTTQDRDMIFVSLVWFLESRNLIDLLSTMADHHLTTRVKVAWPKWSVLNNS